MLGKVPSWFLTFKKKKKAVTVDIFMASLEGSVWLEVPAMQSAPHFPAGTQNPPTSFPSL